MPRSAQPGGGGAEGRHTRPPVIGGDHTVERGGLVGHVAFSFSIMLVLGMFVSGMVRARPLVP